MDPVLFLTLTQDGIISGAIYALLGLSLTLVFTVTRVIFVPQGEYVTYGALTMAMLQMGQIPATIYLCAAMGIFACLHGLYLDRYQLTRQVVATLVGETIVIPALILAVLHWGDIPKAGFWPQALLTIAIVSAIGSYTYRLVFQPLAETSVLILLIAAVATHLVMMGGGLVFFGAEGYRTPEIADYSFQIWKLIVPAQGLAIVLMSALLAAAFYAMFGLTLIGKSLRATAVNRTGAKLVGISPVLAGRISFALAAFVGAVSGILICPITTIYYDTGFLIALKGFVASIVGGLASYPLTVVAAIVVGIVESMSAFAASSMKEVIVFTLIIPVLLWRSLTHFAVEDEE